MKIKNSCSRKKLERNDARANNNFRSIDLPWQSHPRKEWFYRSSELRISGDISRNLLFHSGYLLMTILSFWDLKTDRTNFYLARSFSQNQKEADFFVLTSLVQAIEKDNHALRYISYIPLPLQDRFGTLLFFQWLGEARRCKRR